MIYPATSVASSAVASHYDELDAFYRDVWGEHLHHGLWHRRGTSRAQAVLDLVALVADKAQARGVRVCDVGCGYGATSRVLAAEYGADVTGLTISERQLDYARSVDPGAANPRYVCCDWLDNPLADASFDAVIAIESLSHIGDKPGFFDEAHRVLRPGGRLVICVWLARVAPRPIEIRHVLEPICTEGRLAGMGDHDEYRAMLRGAGFALEEFADLSRRVRRTWSLAARRLISRLVSRREYRRFLLDGSQSNRIFALTAARIWLAYRLGSMEYGLFVARRL